MRPEVGSQVGAYRLRKVIGEGGMGTVFLAEHIALGRRAAIKLLHSDFTGRPEFLVRFFNEARAAAAIADPGIVQIFDFGQHVDGAAYIAMELLEGESLAVRLRNRGRLPSADALAIMRQVASTLGVAHRRGIVHRDLKPDNVFLVKDPEVPGGERTKVLDFGIAKLTDDPISEKHATRAGMVMGTPRYMSPEQCRGAGEIDQRADVYSLGCILFELVAGAAPFEAEGAGELLSMHLTVPPPSLASRAPGVSDELAALVQRCLAKAPRDRYASGAELAAAICRAQGLGPKGGRVGDPARGMEPAFCDDPAPTDEPSPGAAIAPVARPGDPLLPGHGGPGPRKTVMSAPGDIEPPKPGKTIVAGGATLAPPTAREEAMPAAVSSLPPTVIGERRSAGGPSDAPDLPLELPSIEPPVPRDVAAPPVLPGDLAPPSSGPPVSPGDPSHPSAVPPVLPGDPARPSAGRPLPSPGATSGLPSPSSLPWSLPSTPSSPATGASASASPFPSSPLPSSPFPSSPLPWTSASPSASPSSATGTTPPSPTLFPKEPLRWITRLIPSLTHQDTEPHDGLAAAFEGAVPPGMRDSLASFVAFFGELFATASRFKDRAIQLGEPALDDLAARCHYVLFVDDAGTVAFRAGVTPLAEQLMGLATPSGSVVIAVLAGLELGQGSRETIFTLRKERNLFVVPIAATEIRRACETGEAQLVLLDRISDLHAVNDPFAVSNEFTDPTRCIGFAREVSDLVSHITAGGRIVSVAGPPGSGKSTVVAMAEYGCDTSRVARRFIRLSCSELVGRDPDTLLLQLHEQIRPPATDLAGMPSALGTMPPPEGVSIHKTIMMLDASSAPAGGAIAEKRRQLVIVLEDADWLLRLASSAEPDEQRRVRTRELWRSLAQLCASGGHTVIVTSIRDFEPMDQGTGEHPVAISPIPLRALGPRESDRLITALGEPIGFQPTRRALAALHHLSGGNIYALRLLCSTIIRIARDRPGYSPLARLEVTRRMVMRAADDIAETGITFRPHVEGWLDQGERIVLQHIARARPRSPRSIRHALEDAAADIRIGEALDGLERMQLIERRGRRHRVRVPLFERWINIHLEAPAQLRRARKQSQLRWLALGTTFVTLLGIAYWTWLRSTRTSEPAVLDDCTFELDHPDRVGTDETIVLNVFQECKTPKPHALAIEPVMSSLTLHPPTTNCTESPMSCTTTFAPTAGPQAHDEYRVRLRVDDRPLVLAAIKKDGFASMRAFGEKTVPVLAIITAVLTAIGAFYKELWRSAAHLIRRGGEPPAPPGGGTA